jgi:DnaK suppressor protein
MPLNVALSPEREAVRRKLQARAAQLRREIGATMHDAGERADAGLPNRNAEVDDAAVAESETLLDIAGVQRDVLELDDVMAALAKLATPDYGLCEDCSAVIDPARLAAKPQARRCIDCEREAERRDKSGRAA